MAEIITADHGKESGHWYKHNGSPAYTIIGSNGKERPTTLRDARKLGLVPGVSTINKCAAAPGLDNWKIDQAILSALTLPRLSEEPEAAYLSRIKLDAREQAKKAAERGTLIHAYAQKGFSASPQPSPREAMPYILCVKAKLLDECGPCDWICEQSFATDKYGGKPDLHSDKYLIDIKTTDKDMAKLETWPEQHMQLAAYENGLGRNSRKCGILYIHKDTAESRLIWIESKELEKGWKMFEALLSYYYAKTNLDIQPEGA